MVLGGTDWDGKVLVKKCDFWLTFYYKLKLYKCNFLQIISQFLKITIDLVKTKHFETTNEQYNEFRNIRIFTDFEAYLHILKKSGA